MEPITIAKQLGGVEDLLLDAQEPLYVMQRRNGQMVAIAKLNAATIPYSGTPGTPEFVSLKEAIELGGGGSGIEQGYIVNPRIHVNYGEAEEALLIERHSDFTRMMGKGSVEDSAGLFMYDLTSESAPAHLVMYGAEHVFRDMSGNEVTTVNKLLTAIDNAGGGSTEELGEISSPNLHLNFGEAASSKILRLDYGRLIIAADTDEDEGARIHLASSLSPSYTGNISYYGNNHTFYNADGSEITTLADLLLNNGGSTTLAGLDDTNIPLPTNGYVLTYDTASSRWVAAEVPVAAGATTLAALTDTSLIAPGDGNLISYDAANSVWVSTPAAGAAELGRIINGDLILDVGGADESIVIDRTSDRITLGNSVGSSIELRDDKSLHYYGTHTWYDASDTPIFNNLNLSRAIYGQFTGPWVVLNHGSADEQGVLTRDNVKTQLVSTSNLACRIDLFDVSAIHYHADTHVWYDETNNVLATLADLLQDTVYVHPTAAGSKHIPSGGAAAQILTWSASGTAVWATPAAGATELGHVTEHSLYLDYGGADEARIIRRLSTQTIFRAEEAASSSLTLTDANDIYLQTPTAGHIYMPQLPSADPGIAGALWKNGTYVSVSAGGGD